MDNFDEMFAQYAKQKEQEVKSIRSSNSFQRNYETVKWTGLEQGVPSVIRVVGGPPDSNVTPGTAKTVTIARIIGDDGKQFRLIRPSFSDDKNYIINKIIQRVKTVKWKKDGQKTYPVQEAYPEIYNIIDKCGLNPEDKRYKFERGWVGRECLIMNVIDRSQMDWHRENKHTMLLAKSINVDASGNEWPDEGISVFATSPKFNQLFKYYGSWEKYDIAITRTGDMSNAYNIDNASKNPEKVEGGMDQFISFETGLTSEEKSWATYDLSTMYKPTSPIRLYNKLKDTIRKIDNALGTDFLTELRDLAEAEKKRLDEEAEKTDIFADTKTTETPTVSTQRLRETSKVSTAAVGSEMPYYSSLSESVRSKIISCNKGEDFNNEQGNSVEHFDVEWDYDPINVLPCPNCGTNAPEEVTKCPCCGVEFS